MFLHACDVVSTHFVAKDRVKVQSSNNEGLLASTGCVIFNI